MKGRLVGVIAGPTLLENVKTLANNLAAIAKPFEDTIVTEWEGGRRDGNWWKLKGKREMIVGSEEASDQHNSQNKPSCSPCGTTGRTTKRADAQETVSTNGDDQPEGKEGRREEKGSKAK